MTHRDLTPAATIAIVVAAFVGVVFALLSGLVKPAADNPAAWVVLTTLCCGFLTCLQYALGSSLGSRAKDELLAQVVTGGAPPVAPAPAQPNQKTVPIPQPAPPLAPPTPKKFTVTATVFGQAGDGQDQIAYADVKPGWPNRPGVALPFRFAGTRPRVHVWGPKGDVVCEIVDVGPWNTHDPYWQTGSRPQAESGADAGGRHTNGAGIDLTPAAAAAVGIPGKGQVSWAFIDAAPPNLAVSGSPADPPWLTLARAEIGFHEKPDNHGIQKYVDLAGYGADGEPWCSIFAGAMLRQAGIDITGANAMARSWTTAPCVTKLDAPRLGCLAVFWRGSKGGSEGHVGFYIGEDATHVQVLGGNEDDAVEIAPMAKAASSFGLLGYWWPKDEAKVM
jgi:uncharacterized protein (TIGR02594 family)